MANKNEPRVDFVRDTTRVGRLLKKVALGDMTVADLFFGSPTAEEQTQTVAQDEEPTVRADNEHCTVTPGCICVKGHNGGCTLDATVEEVSP